MSERDSAPRYELLAEIERLEALLAEARKVISPFANAACDPDLDAMLPALWMTPDTHRYIGIVASSKDEQLVKMLEIDHLRAAAAFIGKLP